MMQELMQDQLASTAFHDDSEEGGSAAPAAAPLNNILPGRIRRINVDNKEAACMRLQSFWEEQGLNSGVAASVAREMIAAGSPFCDLAMLQAQMQCLARVIPSSVQVQADVVCMFKRCVRVPKPPSHTHTYERTVQDMVARDWRILHATPRLVAAHYVQLVELFGGSGAGAPVDVADLASRNPKLL
jgi:hypothetical protein